MSRSQRHILKSAALDDLAEKVARRADWPQRLKAARSWASAYQSTDAEHTKEESLQGTFLQRVFIDILGYRDQGAGGSSWTLQTEPSTEIDSRKADGSVGFFHAQSKKTKGVIELKDALTDLDAKQLSRRDRLSPVEQAFLYLASFERAKYAFVSNFRTLRLYARRFGLTRYQEFDLTRLSDPGQLARFAGVCSAEVVLGPEPGDLSTLDRSLAAIQFRPQQEITTDFYEHYATYRDRLVRYVAEERPDLGGAVIRHVQKFLDRVLFVLFAEDVGLLPDQILGKSIQQGLRSRARRKDRAWQELLYLFEDIDRGRPDFNPSINKYYGGLFAYDEVVDKELSLPDELIEHLQSFEYYDFRTEIDVNILGHVFENSLVDIELLRRRLSLDPFSVEKSLAAVDQQRKEYGIYYTPSWVTHFVADQTLGRHLQAAGDPDERLRVSILDPACGSGAFLSEVLSYLTTYSRGLASAAVQEGTGDLYDGVTSVTATDHLDQIFGIDILAEAVEISKLSLWLKSASTSRPLADIDTVLVGNSLQSLDELDPSALLGSKLRSGKGFNIVLGNPPWGAKLGYPVDKALQLQEGQFDSYELFVERALQDMCTEEGYFGFVIPDRILRPEGERLRRFLFDKYRVLTILKLGEGVFPGVYRAAVVVIVQKTEPLANSSYEGLVVTKEDRQELEEEGNARLATLMEQRGGTIACERVTTDRHYNIALAPDADLKIQEKMRDGARDWLGKSGLFGAYGRGEELGRNTFIVQCPGCFKWSVNPRKRAERRGGGYESKVCPHCEHEFAVGEAVDRRIPVMAEYDPEDPNQSPLFSGEQVNRYWLDPPLGLVHDIDGISYKPNELYEGPKLLIRQTGVGVYATIDESSARCLQSVYVYKLRDGQKVALEFYLAQLCSRAMLFYFFMLTNQVEWQSFPKLTHSTLQQLPLRRPDLEDAAERTRHDQVVHLVKDRLARGSEEGHEGPSTESLEVDFEIERLVGGIYGLGPNEVARITRRLQPLQNIRIIRELYPSQ